MAKHPKRAWSRAFTPADNKGHNLTISRVPAPLLKAVRRKAKQEGASMRALVLQYLAKYAGYNHETEGKDNAA